MVAAFRPVLSIVVLEVVDAYGASNIRRPGESVELIRNISLNPYRRVS